MQRREFGKTGLQVTPLGFGGAPIGYLETDQQRVAEVLNTLLDGGVNVIDTAPSYEGSEEAIAKAVGHRRQDFILISKCGNALQSFDNESWTPRVIRQTIERSLRRLRTDYLDVVLLHSCELAVLEQGDALAAAVEARDAGQVRFVGYSGDEEAAAYAATLDDVAVLELSINICDQQNIDGVLPAARERNLGVIAKRPLANAAWKEPFQLPGMYATYAEEYCRRFTAMGLSLADLGFDGPPDEFWPEIALRFVLSLPDIHTAIVGTTRTEHAQANLAAAVNGPLPNEIVEKLRQAFAAAKSQAATEWVGMT